ncbi:MAG: triose-phosphate isomerase [Planctomycetota bacterium]|nr:triose-phosphate isomerase [Planctomycetota bacterium]
MSTPTRTPLIAGNWKMNGSLGDARTWAEAAAAAAAASANDVAVFPPAPWLMAVGGSLADAGGGVTLGGQACAWEAAGAFTGAVAASMLAEAGCRMVLCGHSERRHVFGERDADVAGGLARALEAGLEPILCVGETLEEREAGQTEAVILRQLDAGLACLRSAEDPLTIAYEPVWAIGTGKAATPVEAAAAHASLRARVAETDAERAARVRILYGGSANPDNMGGFLEVSDVDGLLIGGASLDPAKFAAMVGYTPAG